MSTTTATSCGGSVDNFTRRCPRPAAVVVLVGCIHEHVAERPVCTGHLQRVLDGTVVCRMCREYDGHRCPLHAGPRITAINGGTS